MADMTRKEMVEKIASLIRAGDVMNHGSEEIATKIVDAIRPREKGRVRLFAGLYVEFTEGRWVARHQDGQLATDSTRLVDVINGAVRPTDSEYFRIVRECEQLQARGGYADE